MAYVGWCLSSVRLPLLDLKTRAQERLILSIVQSLWNSSKHRKIRWDLSHVGLVTFLRDCLPFFSCVSVFLSSVVGGCWLKPGSLANASLWWDSLRRVIFNGFFRFGSLSFITQGRITGEKEKEEERKGRRRRIQDEASNRWSSQRTLRGSSTEFGDTSMCMCVKRPKHLRRTRAPTFSSDL